MSGSEPPRPGLRQPLVNLGDPCGEITIHGDRLEIGTVIIWPDGEIEAIPRHAITEAQRSVLRRAAESVVMTGPEEGWLFNPALGWIGCACVDQSGSEASFDRFSSSD